MSQQLNPPKPVKLIVGMLSGAGELFEPVEKKMQSLWGPIDLGSEITAFTHTRYYEKEMGPNLFRKFVSFANLIDPDSLATIKHQSNKLEAESAQSPEGKAVGVARPINLDPGYIDPSKLVLASTKNYSHRIYIGQLIYAEPTLHYRQGRWQAWPFTYPDYASGNYDVFLNEARQRLMEQYSSLRNNT